MAASPAFAHRLPGVFKEPDSYQPDRFQKGRQEDKMPYAFIGFGGGRHGCLGQNFAYLQIKVRPSLIDTHSTWPSVKRGSCHGNDNHSIGNRHRKRGRSHTSHHCIAASECRTCSTHSELGPWGRVPGRLCEPITQVGGWQRRA